MLPRDRSRTAFATAVAASAAGLVLAVVVVSNRSSPNALYQRSMPVSSRMAASSRVAAAQAKVKRDMAALHRTEVQASGRKTQKLGSFGEVAKWGPRANDQYDFERKPSEGGLPLATPEYEFSRTPEVKSREGDPPFHYGANPRYCPGGNCEPLDEAAPADHFANERWPTDMYRAVPWMGFDPDAMPARNRAINQREGEFADELRPDTYHPPVHWGVGGLEGSGTMADEDRGAANLEKASVAHDKWPWDIYRSLPYPGFDRTQMDQDAHADRYPHMDPLEQARETAESKQALVDAGVDVDRSPTDTNERTYNAVDGLNDNLVPVEDAPKWRKGGIAAQEEPSSFLLSEHPDMSGPQPTQDAELGYELEPKKATKDQQAYWGFWDSIGCGTNGCFGARNGPDGEGA